MNDSTVQTLDYPRFGAPFDDGPRTFARLILHWAALQPEATACVMLGEDADETERLTYRELRDAAAQLAVEISQSARPGARALLMFPTGLAFVIAFVACHFAGVVPVPVVPVRARRLRDASMQVASDCEPDLVLTEREHEDGAREHLRQLPELAHTRIVAIEFASYAGVTTAAAFDELPGIAVPSPYAFLQYTSGSTSAPKGVAVSQANLFANLEMQRRAFSNPFGVTYVGWTPLYHDMGLIGNLLELLYLGGRSVLMSPGTFAQAPWLWLRAIARYGARVSGGPNFAYDLCVARADRILAEAMDLSCWTIAYNSAEPVRADTIRRFTETFAALGFRAEAMQPCYGMAEATLLVSAPLAVGAPRIETVDKAALALGRARPASDGADAHLSVACGRTLDAERIVIVDPTTGVVRENGEVGEIWVHGPHIPLGYWNRPDASRETFHAKVSGDPLQLRYLRTGDLGYVLGEALFVAGRLKDVIIVRGRNVYPQDIERVAERAYSGMKVNSGAAFVVGEGGAGDDEPRYVLVQEVERAVRRSLDRDAAAKAIRRAVIQEFELTLNVIVFVEPSSIPKTSSGKIRRRETHGQYLEGTLARLDAARKLVSAVVGEVSHAAN